MLTSEVDHSSKKIRDFFRTMMKGKEQQEGARKADVKRHEKETYRLIFEFYEDELQNRIE